MRKRLFCILLAVSMIGSSLTVYATEPEEPQSAESPAANGQEDGEELPDAAETPETIPVTDSESAEEEPCASPEAEPAVTPDPTPEESPETEPESSPAPEESDSADLTVQESEDGLLAATVTYTGQNNVDGDMTLDQGWVINGDLKIGSKGRLRIGNNKLEVNGNVECSGSIDMDVGSILIINGNFIHGAGNLNMGGGRVDITGDYRMQNKDGAGEYSVGEGTLHMENASSRLDIGGSFIAQSRRAASWPYIGTMTVKGCVFYTSPSPRDD